MKNKNIKLKFKIIKASTLIINYCMIQNISTDLIIEILCKLECNSIDVVFINKQVYSAFIHNKRFIIKNIVNSYNLIFTDLSNILFIKNKKVDAIELINEDELIDSIAIGHLENVKFLLKNGANIHAYSDYALRFASECGHIEVMKLLIEAGADIHACSDDALRLASRHGHIEIVKLLIDHGADIHAHSDLALISASMYGHIEIVKLLIDLGADIHACSDLALRYASQFGYTETVKLLIEAGADIHACDDYALRWASHGGGRTEIVKLLKTAAESSSD